jgi:hypothetical protein
MTAADANDAALCPTEMTIAAAGRARSVALLVNTPSKLTS